VVAVRFAAPITTNTTSQSLAIRRQYLIFPSAYRIMSVNKLLAHLYCLHADELNRFLSRRTASAEQAADLVQEMFLRLIERDSAAEEIRHPRGYLYRSAKNIAAESWRSSSPKTEVVDVAGLQAEEEPSSPSPETLLHQQQTNALLLAAIENLPPRCREVFMLHKFEGLTYNQIAAQLGITTSAVEKQMMRAMQACRSAIDEASH